MFLEYIKTKDFKFEIITGFIFLLVFAAVSNFFDITIAFILTLLFILLFYSVSFISLNKKPTNVYLFLLLFFAPLEKIHWYQFFAIKPVIILGLLGAYLFIIHIIVKPTINKNIKIAASLYFLIFLSMLLSTYFSINSYRSFRLLSLYIIIFSYSLTLIYIIKENSHLKLILNTWLAVGVFTAIYGLLQLYLKYRGIELDELVSDFLKTNPVSFRINPISKYGYRINAFFGDANNYAAYLNTVIPISLFFLMNCINSGKRSKILLYFITTAILLVVVFLTFSRSGWLGTITVLAVFFIKFRKYFFKTSYLKIWMIVFIVLACLFLIYKDILLLLLNIRLSRDIGSTSIHILHIKFSIKLFFSNPIFGIGIGNYGDMFYRDFLNLANPHSTFLTWLSEIGLIGFILNFSVIILSLFYLRKMIKSNNESHRFYGWILLTSYLGLLASNVFYQTYAYHFYNIFQAVVLACGNFINNRNIDKKIAQSNNE
ncbi:O-antigen ligase family protein [candidate division KSB1 bacterium]